MSDTMNSDHALATLLFSTSLAHDMLSMLRAAVDRGHPTKGMLALQRTDAEGVEWQASVWEIEPDGLSFDRLEIHRNHQRIMTLHASQFQPHALLAA